MQFRFRAGCLIAFASSVLLAPSTLAQTTLPGLQARLVQKQLYLRGQWRQNKLKFNSAGVTSTPAGSAPFTLCVIHVDDVSFAGDGIVIQGDRLGVEFSPPQLVSVHQRIQIEITGTPGKDFGPALNKIFADSLADLTTSLPPSWQPFARANFLQQEDADADPDKPAQPEGQATEPAVLSLTPPVSTDIANSLKYSGTVRVRFVVNPDGSAANPRIVSALGLGLDEQAIAAVLQSRFKPATLDGKPVARELVLDVKFPNP